MVKRITISILITLSIVIGTAAWAHAAPGISNLVLHASSPDVLTTDDLICTYDLTDATTAAITWYKDATPLMTLYTPFEGGSTNALLDLSGNSHIVTAMGTHQWLSTGGHDGHGALEFGPSFHINAGEVFPTLSSYTKVAWINMTDDSGSNNIMSSQDINSGHVFYASYSQDYKLTAGHHDGSSNAVRDEVPLDLGVWYHAAVSFDYTTGMMVLYKNGLVVDTGTVSEDKRDVTDGTLLIGAFHDGNEWRGLIDEARLYDYVLTSEQILALYHGPDTLKSTETRVGEHWYADVTPFSSTEMGATVTSNTLQINAEIWMEPDTVYYQNSEAFYLNTYCGPGLIGAKVFHFELTFDPSVVVGSADSVSLGSMFDGLKDDTVTVLFSQLWVDSTHLEIDIAYLRDSATLDGPGEIFVLPVVPTGFGQTDIQITNVLIFDRYNQQIPVNIIGSTYARICQFVGDVDMNNTINIADLVYMVDYMFTGGPDPRPNVESANFNCDASVIDISDLVAFVDWMFTQGPFMCYPPCVSGP